MNFSWNALSGIDIGLLSISLIGLWVMKKWADKRLEAQKAEYDSLQEAQKAEYDSLQEAQKAEYDSLQAKHNSLREEFKAFQSAADRRYAVLRTENEELKKENKFLRKEVARHADEIDELKQAFYGLQGRYDELKELLNQLIAKF